MYALSHFTLFSKTNFFSKQQHLTYRDALYDLIYQYKRVNGESNNKPSAS